MGGDGGVGASDTVDEADFAGGVAMVGDEVVVAGEASESGECGRAIPEPSAIGFLEFCCSIEATACRSFN